MSPAKARLHDSFSLSPPRVTTKKVNRGAAPWQEIHGQNLLFYTHFSTHSSYQILYSFKSCLNLAKSEVL